MIGYHDHVSASPTPDTKIQTKQNQSALRQNVMLEREKQLFICKMKER